MGHQARIPASCTWTSCAFPDRQRLGPLQCNGLSVAMDGVNAGRLSMAGSCVGIARWALNQALAYVKIRKTFGRLIAEHQAVQIMLAECAMDIYAVKSMLRHCAWLIDGACDATKGSLDGQGLRHRNGEPRRGQGNSSAWRHRF